LTEGKEALNTMRLASLALLLVAPLALAQEPKTADKVEVHAEVVLAAKDGAELDPPALKAMQQAFAENKVTYGYLKRVHDEKVPVTVKAVTVKLPNGKIASLVLEKLKADVATIRVEVPPTKAVYTPGQKGNLYVPGGKHDGKDVWLVLSPAK
jgi:hypothetical protein